MQAIRNVPEQLVVAVRAHLDALQGRQVLSYNFGVEGIDFGSSGGGNFGTLTVSLIPKIVGAFIAVKNELPLTT